MATYHFYSSHIQRSQGKHAVAKAAYRGTQVLLLQSKSPEALLSVIGQLQNEGLLIQSLNYTLSNDKRDAIRNSMIESAIAKLKQQAMRVAKALGQEYSRFTMINIDTGLRTRPPMPIYRNATPALCRLCRIYTSCLVLSLKPKILDIMLPLTF